MSRFPASTLLEAERAQPGGFQSLMRSRLNNSIAPSLSRNSLLPASFTIYFESPDWRLVGMNETHKMSS